MCIEMQKSQNFSLGDRSSAPLDLLLEKATSVCVAVSKLLSVGEREKYEVENPT